VADASISIGIAVPVLTILLINRKLIAKISFADSQLGMECLLFKNNITFTLNEKSN
jgi:hypothetical protein